MAFGQSTVLDNFNRANGLPGTAWGNAHSWSGTAIFQIAGSAAAPSNDYCIGYYTPSTYGPDCEVFATLATPTTAAEDGPYLFLRLTQIGQNTVDGYFLAVESSGSRWIIGKLTNGGTSALGSIVNGGITSGDKIGLEVIGSTLTAYRKSGAGAWTQILQRTDSTYSGTGYLGLYIGANESVTRMDDFSGGTATAPSTSLTLPSIARRNAHLLVR